MNWLGSLANDFTVKHPGSKMPPSISGRREKARNMTGWVIDGTAFGFQALGLLHLSSPLTFVTALWWGHYCNHSLWAEENKNNNQKPRSQRMKKKWIVTSPWPHILNRSNSCIFWGISLFLSSELLNVTVSPVPVFSPASKMPCTNVLPPCSKYRHCYNTCFWWIPILVPFCCCCSVTKSCLTLCWPHGLQHTRLPCPSPSPRAGLNSCPLSRWWYPAISSSPPSSPLALSLSQHQGLFLMFRLLCSYFLHL